MQRGKASGLQIAFFTFAVLLLAVPLTQYVGRNLELEKVWVDTLTRVGQFAVLGVIIAIAERASPGIITRLLQPVPLERRLEIAVVTGAKLLLPFAVIGGMVAWH